MEFDVSLYWYKDTEKDSLSVIGVIGSSSSQVKFKSALDSKLVSDKINETIKEGMQVIKNPQKMHKYFEKNSNWMSYGVGKHFKVEGSDLDSALDTAIKMYRNGEIQ